MELNNNFTIKVERLSLEYHELIRKRNNPFGRIIPFQALKEIDFEIGRGETVALLGRNGAGKTTLLSCIAGQLRPSSGKIITDGRVIVLKGADPGLVPDLSGRQNVTELGSAYGVGDDEISDFVASVEEFANLGSAFDRRFGGYSTGMRGKVGFGFITALKPDLLLIDETLSVGDREFKAKAQVRLRSFIERSGSVVISTHSLGLAKEVCSRGIVLEDGEVYFDGGIQEAIDQYVEISNH
jgi:ABC-type polysaccharide/polyol phosphate transport system ATPase subunit